MSVTSVSSSLLPSYGPLSGSTSRNAKVAAGSTQDIAALQLQAGKNPVEAGYADPTEVSQFQNAWAGALRADGAIPGRPGSGNSAQNGTRSSSGTSLYKLVSRMGNNDPSTAALLRSWNSIMQTGQDAGDGGAFTLQASLQYEVPAFETSTFHLTA